MTKKAFQAEYTLELVSQARKEEREAIREKILKHTENTDGIEDLRPILNNIRAILNNEDLSLVEEEK